jgi:hypothetical protein
MIFHGFAIILSLMGLVGILIELGGTWRSVTGKAILHSVFGIIAFTVLFVNGILGGMGFGTKGESRIPLEERYDLRKSMEHRPNLHYYRWMHWYLGNCVYIFGSKITNYSRQQRMSLSLDAKWNNVTLLIS